MVADFAKWVERQLVKCVGVLPRASSFDRGFDWGLWSARATDRNWRLGRACRTTSTTSNAALADSNFWWTDIAGAHWSGRRVS